MWALLLATVVVGIAFAAVSAARRDLQLKRANQTTRSDQTSCCCCKHHASHR
jgi:hypothetical protein